MSVVKKVFSHSIIYALGPQLPKVVGIFLLPVFTPYLSSVDFGIWGTILAYTLFFTSARDFGMTAPMLNSYYKNPKRWIFTWRQVYFYLLILGFFFTALELIVVAAALPVEGEPNKLLLLFLIGFQSLLLDPPNILGVRYYQLSEKPVVISIVSFLAGIISIAVQYYYIVQCKVGYMGWFYATFFSNLFSSSCYALLLYRKEIKPLFVFRYRNLRSLLRVSLPLIPHNYSAYLLNASDRVIMSYYRVPTFNVGLYNIAYIWGNYLEILGNAIGMAVGPIYLKYFSSRNPQSEEKVKFLTYFLQLNFILGSFTVALWSKELFCVFVKNKELALAYPIAIVIIMSYSYRPLYWTVINKLQFYEKTQELWKITLIGGVINVVLNAIFIPYYGFKVAAITTFISLLYIGFSGFSLKAYKKIDSQNYNLMVWFFLILSMTIAAFVLKDVSVIFKALITVFVLSVSIIVSSKFIPKFN